MVTYSNMISLFQYMNDCLIEVDGFPTLDFPSFEILPRNTYIYTA